MPILTVHFYFRGQGLLDVVVDRIRDTGKTWTNPLGTVIPKHELQRNWASKKGIPCTPPADDATALQLGAQELLKLLRPGVAKLNYVDEDELLDYPWPEAC